MGIGLAALLSVVEASEWYEDLPVGAVSIVSVDGYVPDGDLQSLLTTQVGELFAPNQVRDDLSTLYTMGEFSSIKVNLLNDSIDDLPFLHVQYQIQVAPRLDEIVIISESRQLTKTIEAIVPFSLGQVFHPAVEMWKLRRHLINKLEGLGYVGVEFDLDYTVSDGQKVLVTIEVEQAIPNLYDSIDIVNLPSSLQRPYRKLLREFDIGAGQRIQVRRLDDFKSNLQTLLQNEGWLDAKVRLLLQQTPNQTQELHILIEPNKRVNVILRETDLGFRLTNQLNKQDVLRESLSIYSGNWLSEKDIPRMTEAMLGRLESIGFWDARVELEIRETPFQISVFLDVNAGIKHEIDAIIINESQTVVTPENGLVSVFTEAELQSTLTYERPELDIGLLLKEPYNREIFSEGLDSIRAAYIGAGYLDVEIAVADDVLTQGSVKSHALTVSVNPGAEHQIGTVRVSGGLDSVNQDVVQELTGVYNPSRIEAVKDALENAYQESGFLYSSVEVVSVPTQNQMVDVEFTVELSELVWLRHVGVRGNQITHRSVIDDALGLEAGIPLTPSLLEGVRNDLNALDIFSSTTLMLTGDNPTQQDLLLVLEERPQWAFRTGASLATDLGVLAIGSVQNRNVQGKGQQAFMLGQFGYAWTEDSRRFDSTEPIWRLATTYTAPRTPIQMSNLRFESIFQEIVQQPNYRLVQSGLGMGLGLAPNNDVNMLIEYRVKRMILDDVEPRLLIDNEPWTAFTDEEPIRWWSGVQGSMILDFRNDPFNPTLGTILSGDIKIGDGLLNQLPTVRLSGALSTLKPMDPFRWKVGLSWGIGRTNDDSPLPLEDRFFLGGSNSMRGFARNQVGPANKSSWTDFEYPEQIDGLVDQYFRESAGERWIATGGDYFALANIELHYPLKKWNMEESSFVFFTDVGHIDFISLQSITDSTEANLDPLFRYCVGLGFRYSTVIGPIALDLGINPSPMLERGETWFVPNLSFGSL